MKHLPITTIILSLIGFNLAILIAHLVFAHLLFHVPMSEHVYYTLLKFDMDQEISIPTWFAQSLLVLNAVAAAIIAWSYKQKKQAWGAWAAIAVLIALLSADESASIHEMLTKPVTDVLGIDSGVGFITAWIIPVAVIFLVIAAFFARFYWNLPRHYQFVFAGAVILFFAGAIGMEWYSAHYVYANDLIYDQRYMLYAGIEETLEASGSIMALYGLLSYLKKEVWKS